MLINLSNIGNCLKRVHFFCMGSANYGFDFCNFPIFPKLLVCVKSKETSREFTNFCIRYAFIICIPSMLLFAFLSSFYLLIVCSNNLIRSRKSYKYVINKSCSGLRGKILYALESCQLSNLLMTSSPEETTLSTFQKPFISN